MLVAMIYVFDVVNFQNSSFVIYILKYLYVKKGQ